MFFFLIKKKFHDIDFRYNLRRKKIHSFDPYYMTRPSLQLKTTL